MSRRLIAGAGLVVVLGAQGVVAAWATGSPTPPPSATASDGGNTIHVGVRGASGHGGHPGTGRHRGRSPGRGAKPSPPPTSTPPPTCTEVSLPTKYAAPLGPGGIAGGVFGLATCTGGTLTLANGIVVFVPTAPAATSAVRATPATTLVEQAESALALPAPVIGRNPAGFSIVNLPTWLWIDPSSWRPFTATARAGTVSATVVAVPQAVSWSMGDGGTVVCSGPGTPYQPDEPSSRQSPSCAYTYRTSSYGHGAAGDPDAGTFTLTATITWAVTWSATGAPGGGPLPPLTTSAGVAVRVEQVESVDTAA